MSQDQTTLSDEDIEAILLVRTAARVALGGGRIAEQFQARTWAAIQRVTALCAREAARAREDPTERCGARLTRVVLLRADGHADR